MASAATNTYQTAVYNLLSNVFAYIALTGPCISFYLFTLSSKLFRRELKILFLCGGIVRRRPKRVQPKLPTTLKTYEFIMNKEHIQIISNVVTNAIYVTYI